MSGLSLIKAISKLQDLDGYPAAYENCNGVSDLAEGIYNVLVEGDVVVVGDGARVLSRDEKGFHLRRFHLQLSQAVHHDTLAPDRRSRRNVLPTSED